ncbi:MAG: ABC transporter permease [Candidatus Aminicenantes bacterium]|nr:ABC transporter permease [Candidatus Aminicenantes bacterium]
MFDLENQIRNWLRTLRRSTDLEDSDIAELESHFRDEIDFQIENGLNEEAAFLAAQEKSAPSKILRQEYKTAKLYERSRPFWHPSRFLSSLVWSNIKIALRKIKRQKGFSFINIMGLAIGMACCILILLFVFDELSYDKFHENHDRIFRVTRQWLNEDGVVSLHLGHVAPPIGPFLENDYPEIVQSVRIIGAGGLLVGRGADFFEESRFFFAEQEFFNVFTYEMVAGDPETALRDPMTVVITQEMAQKYFGSENPLGQSITVKADAIKVDMTVSGVIKTMPHNSHFHADILGSFKTYEAMVEEEEMRSWTSNDFATYLHLEENYDISRLKNQLDAFIDRHPAAGSSKQTKLQLQKLTEIHLHSHLDSEIEANSDITYVYIFSLVAFFVLLIACINFMNLATARSSGRAKEVGLLKVVGAQRPQLIRKFLGESILTAVISLLIAMIMVSVVLPQFNQFIGRSLSFNLVSNLSLVFLLFLLAIFVGILSGIYPALFLSAFKPVRVLKGELDSGKKGLSFRTVLVVFQFAISIVLIICVSVVSSQLSYMQTRKLGFDKAHVAVLPSSQAMVQNLDSFKSRLLQNTNILSVSAAKRVPSGSLLDASGASVLSGETSQPITFHIAQLVVDYDYIPTFKMEMAAGRNFSREIRTDSKQAFILNETAIRRIGWKTPEEAINQGFGYGSRRGQIIGVVKDFHFESLHQEIAPIVMFLSSVDLNQISIRINSLNTPQTMAFLKDIWSEMRPEYPFSYFFIDENFDQLYSSEEKLHRIFSYFAFLSIFIGCLGLFGLASYTAERRTKEIAVRKILGASAGGLVTLLSKEFSKWILLANVIAWPLGYFIMSRWLQNFAYRSGIAVWAFFMAGGLAWAIAFLTVSYQTIKVSIADPVASLKYE